MSKETQYRSYRFNAIRTVRHLQGVTDLDEMYDTLERTQHLVAPGPNCIRGPLDKLASRVFEAQQNGREPKKLANRLAKTLEQLKAAPITRGEKLQATADQLNKRRGKA